MSSDVDLRFVEPFLREMRKLNNNHQCLYPYCKQKPISSHVIAESVLERIADPEGKVLSWEPSYHSIVVDTVQGRTWDYIYKHPRRVGIRQDVTYPIFCREHDNDVFAALEDRGFSFHPRQIALLAYRALCYKTWNPHTEEIFEFLLSNKDPNTSLALERIASLKVLVGARQKLEGILAMRDDSQIHRQMQWITRLLYIKPCITCTDANIPFHGEEGAKAIANGSDILAPEDVMTFTLFPEKNLQACICVITWFRGNSRSKNFIDALELGHSSEEVIRENVLLNALRMSLVYGSQAWWNSLTTEQQEYVSVLQVSNAKFLEEIVSKATNVGEEA